MTPEQTIVYGEHCTGSAARLEQARVEVLCRAPLFLLDGGHNPQCARALARLLEDELSGQKVTFLMGGLSDKDYDAMLDTVLPFAAGFVCAAPGSPQAMDPGALADVIRGKCGVPAAACADTAEAISTALSTGRPVVVFGSLYLAEAVRSEFPRAFRNWLRREKIRARDALSPAERTRRSELVVRNLLASPEFQAAQTVLLYRATRGEVRLEGLAAAPEARGKQIAYPLCISDTEMIALIPRDGDAWVDGYCGIREPDQSKSRFVLPKEIDLVICPCTAFDEHCNRMGMGAGFYDRYLPRCVSAVTVAAAFQCQRAEQLPISSWDQPMDLVFTEEEVYRRSKRAVPPGEHFI